MSFPRSFALSLALLGAVSAFDSDRAEARHQTEDRAIAQMPDPQKQEADRLLQVGFERYSQGEFREGIQSWERALEIYQAIGDLMGVGNALNNLGIAYRNLRDYAQAEQYYLQSLEIARQLGNKAVEGLTLDNLGAVSREMEEYSKAEQYYLQLLDIARELGNKEVEGNTLGNLGLISQNSGEYAKAEQLFLQSLEIHQAIGNKLGEGKTFNNLGLVYESLGEYAEAEQYLQQSLEIYRELEDRSGEANSLIALGKVYWNRDRFSEAEKYYLESLDIYQKIEDKKGEATSLMALGILYGNSGEYDRAEPYFTRSLEIARVLNDRAVRGGSLNNLGLIYEYREEYVKAEQYYLEALELFRAIANQPAEASVLQNLGNVRQRLKDYTQAEQYYFASIEVREKLRPGLSDRQKVSLFEQQSSVYESLQKVLVVLNKTDTALEVSERGRARAFVELLAKSFTHSDSALPITPPTLSQIKQIAKERNATLVQYSYISTITGTENKKQVKESELYIWAIKPTGEVGFFRKILDSLEREEETGLAQEIATARCFDNYVCRRNITVVTSRGGTSEVRSEGSGISRTAAGEIQRSISQQQQRKWQQLYQILIEPIAELLPTDPSEKVIFIPQGPLFLVPFPALQDPNGQYLIEKHTILTAPSIQVLDFIPQEQQSANEILVVGNPTMPFVGDPPQQLSSLLGAQKEAQDIAEMLQVTPLIGSEATESTVVEKMRSARLIHLATHGSFDPDRGMNSWIALTPTDTDDGLLTAEEIFDLELKADLAILSACDTGRGKITGDGVIGLSRSLLSAGVSSVLVSLWEVPDDATYLLMRQFYQNWQSGEDKAHALRQAMLTTMQQYPSPENWAAFTLMGES